MPLKTVNGFAKAQGKAQWDYHIYLEWVITVLIYVFKSETCRVV